MKPVETGVKADDPASDAMRLRDAAGADDAIERRAAHPAGGAAGAVGGR